MTYSIEHDGGPYPYVSREPTQAECYRYISNGYTPPDRVSERDANVYRYLRGEGPPNYPMPSLYCFSLISKEVDQRACDINIINMMLSQL